ncbi:hypothetical protein K32_47640 [Kaistia sp. 32K]|uniref:hypothetical protein n=1 Tax=Kaistia sp. 32K TaxID=2795690 RepID=UPI001916926E|nr:hypothetical protein [Kaistia sp. 32K]BCP56147.1 hypothetical protein K32_47640 [Kaistia sp. 32K]
MIPASYLFKSLYESRFERPAHGTETQTGPTPQDGLMQLESAQNSRGSRHPSVPFYAILAGFLLAR